MGDKLHAVVSARLPLPVYLKLVEMAERRGSKGLGGIIREVVERGLSSYDNVSHSGGAEKAITGKSSR